MTSRANRHPSSPLVARHRNRLVLPPSHVANSRLLDRFSQLARAPVPREVLSPREVEVLQLMAKSTVNKEIAAELLIGESTVKTHIVHIFNKLGVKGRTEAVAEATRRGIIRL